MKYVICLVMIMASIATAQANRPATMPAFEGTAEYLELSAAIDAAGKAVAGAEMQLKEATASVVGRIRASTEYKAAKAKVDAAEEKLMKARLSGTPQQKLDASSEWNKARQAFEAIEPSALDSDKAIADAKAALATSTNRHADAKRAFAKRKAEADRAEASIELKRWLSELPEAERRFVLRTAEEAAAGANPLIESLNANSAGVLKYRIRIIQIVDGQNCLASYARQTVWLVTPTAGKVDDEWLPEGLPVVVDGTRKYDTAAGSTSTVLLVKSVNLDVITKTRKAAKGK